MKNKAVKIICAIGRWLLDNCLSLVASGACLAFIVEGVRLWMRSFFSEHYEFIFLFLCGAFIVGFLIGASKRFADFYKAYSEKYEMRKHQEKEEIDRFRRLEYEQKKIIGFLQKTAR